MSQSKKKNDSAIPMWAKTGHQKPTSRREFLAHGMIPFAGAMFIPNWINLMLSSPAQAQSAFGCPVPGGGMMPFIQLHLAGGASMGSNFLPHDINLGKLPSYNKLGVGRDAPMEIEFGKVPFAGFTGPVATQRLVSRWLEGVRSTAPATALAKTSFVGIPCSSRDDTTSNEGSPAGMLMKAGLVGTQIQAMSRGGSGPAGIGVQPVGVFPPAPLQVQNFDTIQGALALATKASENLTRKQKTSLLKLVSNLSGEQSRKVATAPSEAVVNQVLDCAGIKNIEISSETTSAVDPRTAAQRIRLGEIWNFGNGNSLAQASMVYSSLNGVAGPVGINLGGYDYHDNTRTTGDQRDLEAGQLVGRMLATAEAMNKDLFLLVTSDGAVGGPESDVPGAQIWTGDAGDKGVMYMIQYSPSGRKETSSFQIGGFTAGQVADQSFATGASMKLATAAVTANYLQLNGRLDLLETVAPRMLDSDLLKKVLRFG